MDKYRIVNENELFHSGIKGMKLGVRRYQNEDGTYTEEGKKRYYKKTALQQYREYNGNDNEKRIAYLERALDETSDSGYSLRSKAAIYSELYELTGNKEYANKAKMATNGALFREDQYDELIREENIWLDKKYKDRMNASVHTLDGWVPIKLPKIPKISLVLLPPIISIPALAIRHVLFGNKTVKKKDRFYNYFKIG